MESHKLEAMENNRYYGLRLISFFCKAITILIAIIGIGLIGADTIRLLNLSSKPSGISVFQLWVNDALVILLSAGFTGFLFFIISQIIDVQMAINKKLIAITNVVQSIDDITDTLEKVQSPSEGANKNHQEIMQILQKQNRMIMKLYRDTVGDPDKLADSIPIKLS